MSQADRVFSRMVPAEPHPSPEDRQYVHIAPRRRGPDAGQGRVVEVVHRRSDRSDAARPERPAAHHAHAETWPEGFQARSAPVPPASVELPAAAPEPAPQVGHVMPGWEPLLPPIEPEAPPAVAVPHRQPKAEPKPPRGRAFADPYATEDTGTNCLRCGYLVEPAREKRGLMTCAACG